jgi:preprotein translocase subunit SecG
MKMENRDMETFNQEGSKKTFWFFFKKPLWWAVYYMIVSTLANILYLPVYGCFKFEPMLYWHEVFIGFIALEMVCLFLTLLFLLVSLVVCLILAIIHRNEYDEIEESEEEITKEKFWKEFRFYCIDYAKTLGTTMIVLTALNVFGTSLYLWLAKKSIPDVWFDFLGRTMAIISYSFVILIVNIAIFFKKAKKRISAQDI